MKLTKKGNFKLRLTTDHVCIITCLMEGTTTEARRDAVEQWGNTWWSDEQDTNLLSAYDSIETSSKLNQGWVVKLKPRELKALHRFIGNTNYGSRNLAVVSNGESWSADRDEVLQQLWDKIDNFMGDIKE